MAGKSETLQIADQLRSANSLADIEAHATTLAASIVSSPVERFVLASSIVLHVSQTRYQRGELSRKDYFDSIVHQSGQIDDARKYLGSVGEGLMQSMVEQGNLITVAVLHPEGQVLNDEAIVSSRRAIQQAEFKVPPKIVKAADSAVLRRAGN